MNYAKLLFDLDALKQNERKPPAKLRALQEKKLRSLLVYANEQSPYYREAFRGLDVKTAPLEAFPALDKTTLLERFDDLITVPGLTQEALRRFDAEEAVSRKAFQEKYHVVHSSGSTGKPGYFLYDEAAWNMMLLGIIRGALWDMSMSQILKLLAGGPRIAYIAATDGRYGGAMAVGDGLDGLRAAQIHLDIKTPLAEWVRRLQAFKPNIVIGYPSAIKILAELVQSGELDLRLIRVISCGEPLGERLRRSLEDVFHVRIVNFYGASESLALGVETDPRNGLYLFDDLNVIEAQDDGIYLTCLYNLAQPLIRYRLSDKLSLRAPDNRYPITRVVGLLGRNEELLWFEDDAGEREFLHPLAVEGFCIEGLLDYQFRQTGNGSFEMLAETAKQASKETICAEMQKQIGAILAEKGLNHVKFKIDFTDHISPDPMTGKKRLIVSAEERSAARS